VESCIACPGFKLGELLLAPVKRRSESFLFEMELPVSHSVLLKYRRGGVLYGNIQKFRGSVFHEFARQKNVGYAAHPQPK
jgi:hypothetical protein